MTRDNLATLRRCQLKHDAEEPPEFWDDPDYDFDWESEDSADD